MKGIIFPSLKLETGIGEMIISSMYHSQEDIDIIAKLTETVEFLHTEKVLSGTYYCFDISYQGGRYHWRTRKS